MENNVCIFLYSKFDNLSNMVLNKIIDNKIEIKCINIDNIDVRNRINDSKDININSLPCLIIISGTDSSIMQYEGVVCNEYIDDIIKNIEMIKNENLHEDIREEVVEEVVKSKKSKKNKIKKPAKKILVDKGNYETILESDYETGEYNIDDFSEKIENDINVTKEKEDIAEKARQMEKERESFIGNDKRK